MLDSLSEVRVFDLSDADGIRHLHTIPSQDGLVHLVLTVDYSGGYRMGAYTMEVEDLGTDPGEDPDTAPWVGLDAPLEGYATASPDVDVFRFEALPGRIYRASADRAVVTRVERMPPLTGLLTTGFPSIERGLFFKVLSAETVLVTVTSLPGPFTLRVEELGRDDHADTFEGATPLDLDMRAQGWLEAPTDVDCFAVELQQRAYSVWRSHYGVDFTFLEADGTTVLPRTEGDPSTVRPRTAGRHSLRITYGQSPQIKPTSYAVELAAP